MKPRVKIAETRTPDGGTMALVQHDRDFLISINGQDLMLSRQHESELELARLGCRHLAENPAPHILIGGLGMGFTLREALDMLGPQSRVVVAELVDAVVEWNREYLGVLNAHPLEDGRVALETGDILDIISGANSRFDAILLDVDNGPDPLTDSGNRHIYRREGLCACRRALCENGCLSVWSAKPGKPFEQLLMNCGFHVRRFRVPVYKGSRSESRFVWVASESKKNLPPGGGAPRGPEKKSVKTGRAKAQLSATKPSHQRVLRDDRN